MQTRLAGLAETAEYHLRLIDPMARTFLEEQMEKYFFGEGIKTPPEYVPHT